MGHCNELALVSPAEQSAGTSALIIEAEQSAGVHVHVLGIEAEQSDASSSGSPIGFSALFCGAFFFCCGGCGGLQIFLEVFFFIFAAGEW